MYQARLNDVPVFSSLKKKELELIAMTRASFRAVESAMPHIHSAVRASIEQRRAQPAR